ncbi:MAG TPA: [LysW]-aminoadipate kinase [Phycisphaerales bacterium]|nr:[LysW]-aminoadipate kinase [Phycisphaerales bacterium]
MSHTPETLVIKIGGGAGIELAPVLAELASLVRSGLRVVLVHGGSAELDALSRQLGHPPRTLTSPSGHASRRTDRRTLELFEMAYCGKVNKQVVEQLQASGVDAIGLSGIDAAVWRAERKSAIRAVEDGRTVMIRDDLSGRVTSVNDALLRSLLDQGYTPVLTPPALAEGGVAVNVDADRAAAATAVSLGADELLLLSNVRGVLRDPADPASLIRSVAEEGPEAVRQAAHGRMKNKVLAAEEAIAGGVRRVVIGCANGDAPIAAARAGAGTVWIAGVPRPSGAAPSSTPSSPLEASHESRCDPHISRHVGAVA